MTKSPQSYDLLLSLVKIHGYFKVLFYYLFIYIYFFNETTHGTEAMEIIMESIVFHFMTSCKYISTVPL